MSETVLTVEHLYKEYKLGVISHGTLYRDIQSWWAKVRGKEDPNSLISSHHGQDVEKDSFLALNDVSFAVKEGDRLGIIGKNGAGKSTLLKILSRITSPTKGMVKIKGRVGSLLEVGTGFHAELTGRENIYLNGSILGMNRHEISRKLDEIVDFAGIEKHLDTPVKRYSSGMMVRLGFAVAAHLDTDILIADEVLAVGDAEFQKKALGKMQDLSTGEGRTVLFVSHQMAAIRQLCRRCILLEHGSIIDDDISEKVIPNYIGMVKEKFIAEPDMASQPDDPVVRYHSIRLTQNGKRAENPMQGELPLEITIEYSILESITGFRFHLDVMDTYGNRILRLFNTCNDHEMISLSRGKYKSSVLIPSRLLGPVSYNLVLYSSIFNVRTCSYPDGVSFPVNVVYTSLFAGPPAGDTFGAMLNNQLPWKTEMLQNI
jgi:lipopolysaccharide transport system ATP-binding protein